MLCTFALLALFASVQGRAVNISNTWVLPEEGFPVFYRYFRDRISWYEADAVCQFHHANLVTVDTTAQYDAVRAYLKELDISSAVWVGLIRSNPDGDFTWTDYRGLSGDGYWSSAPDARAAPLCAAANPAADYRWEARACGGPTVASFICELPVPQWALGNEGCMIRALPALTILYLPESAAVQLTADCGLAGVKRVQCTGNVKREDLLKELSCSEDEEITTVPSLPSSSVSNTNSWTATTDAAVTEQDTTTHEATTEENVTTEHEDDINQSSTVTSTSAPSVHDLNLITNLKPSHNNLYANKLNRINLGKDLDMIHNNNLQSNYIPKIVNEDTLRGGNYLTNEQLEKIEDERHMQHKMLHEEIARVGNIENIFTQPTDHFVPPLVMAKAKISDDMTVLSLEEKHAQQLAEQHFFKQGTLYGQNDHIYHSDTIKSTTAEPKITSFDKDQIATTKNYDNSKKEKMKSYKLKKYNEKLYDPKSKIVKVIDPKIIPIVKPTEQVTTQAEIVSKQPETTVMPRKLNDEQALTLTVTLKEKPEMHEDKTFFTNFNGDVSRLEVIKNSSLSNETEIKLVDVEATEETTNENPIKKFSETTKNVTLNNETIKITIISYSHTTVAPTTYEVTTKLPVIKDTIQNNLALKTNTGVTDEIQDTSENLTSTHFDSTEHHSETKLATNVSSETANEANETLVHVEFVETVSSQIKDEATTTLANNGISNHNNVTESTPTEIPNHEIQTGSDETLDEFGPSYNSSETIDDFNSPLLSGANEPLHRPARTRRPQQPPRNKFNPFRILG